MMMHGLANVKYTGVQAIYDKTAHVHCTAGYQRLQTHSQNMQYSLLFLCNNGCTISLQCSLLYTVCIVKVLNSLIVML